MATTALSVLVQRVRRQVADWPELDVITASASSGAATLTVADASLYGKNRMLQIDGEAMRVTTNAAGTSLGVLRGQYGTTAASHASSSTVLKDPRFLDIEITDGLNEGLDALWPRFYREVTDTSLTPTGTTYEFAVPTIADIGARPIPRIKGIDIRASGLLYYLDYRRFEIIRGGALGVDAPLIKFYTAPLANSSIRIRGYAPLPHLAVTPPYTDTLAPQLPYMADNLAVKWCVQQLLETGEARRVRIDTGATDDREQANRVGSSAAAATGFQQMWGQLVSQWSMPPMEPHLLVAI